METTFAHILSFLLVFSVAIISPGPNFIYVVNRSLTDSRRIGIYTAFGVATGSALFAVTGLLGVIVLITNLPYFSSILRFIGGFYLIYLGAAFILSNSSDQIILNKADPGGFWSPSAAFSSGLLTNLTNPKAWAFYLSLFTFMLGNDFPHWAKFLLAISMFLISLLWYSLVAVLVSNPHFHKTFVRTQPVFKKILGLCLLLFGGRLLIFG